MNKFFSFEMIFSNGQSYMGNLCFPYDDILSNEDVKDVENRIKNLVNVTIQGEDLVVDTVTLMNWKTL